MVQDLGGVGVLGGLGGSHGDDRQKLKKMHPVGAPVFRLSTPINSKILCRCAWSQGALQTVDAMYRLSCKAVNRRAWPSKGNMGGRDSNRAGAVVHGHLGLGLKTEGLAGKQQLASRRRRRNIQRKRRRRTAPRDD